MDETSYKRTKKMENKKVPSVWGRDFSNNFTFINYCITLT